MRAAAFLRRLRADCAGTYLVEMAVVTPVFLVMTLGALDMGHTLYTRAVLQGTVQKAARDSALETGSLTAQQTAITNGITAAVRRMNSQADVRITRRYFRDFSTAKQSRMEPFTDTNNNGRCDNGESYVDNNGSNARDMDSGRSGQGGAKDATLLTVTMSYPRMFPTNTLIGFSDNVSLTAKTLLANQPYADQTAAQVRQCPV